MVNSVASPFLSMVRMTETSPEWASAASSRCSSAEKASASGAWPVGTLPAFCESSMLHRLIESEPKFEIHSVPLSALTMPKTGLLPMGRCRRPRWSGCRSRRNDPEPKLEQKISPPLGLSAS
jgi:hypothetical protein